MTIPQCPIHKVDMVLRTAKKGRNAGKQFWGCPTWGKTRCNQTYPVTDILMDEAKEDKDAAESIEFPRLFSARGIHKGFHVRFFETAASSQKVIEDLNNYENSEDKKRAVSQWRLDYQPKLDRPPWKERERHAFAVIEKILTRGRLTLCSPNLENEYRKRFQTDNSIIDVSNEIDCILHNTPSLKIDSLWLDHESEKLFYQDYLENKYGEQIYNWIIPQVELSSLLSEVSDGELSGRVDFLIYNPNSQPVIVEIDGESHHLHISEDNIRDNALERAGFQVIRIPAAEVENFEGANLEQLDRAMVGINTYKERGANFVNNQKFLNAIKISHQIQLSIIQAIQVGHLSISNADSWNITTDLYKLDLYNYEESSFILKSSIADLIILFRHIGRLYSIKLCDGLPSLFSKAPDAINISFSGRSSKAIDFIVRNIYLPFHIANSIFATTGAILDKPNPQSLQYLLTYIFRKKSFWEGQLDSISRTLEGKDSIVLLPTGAGKSIAFQLASLLLPGRTIVIDPIISLMEDQIDNLKSVGIDRTIAITSQIADVQDRNKALSLVGQGEYFFVYVSPIRFQIIDFRNALKSLTTHTPISLIAIDEAHCVSEWGHSFIPAYLNIGSVSREHCEAGGFIPPLLALTGTASRSVLKDIQRELHIEEFDAIITPKSFDRPELKFHIISSDSEEKSSRLIGFLGQSIPSFFSIAPSHFFQPNEKSTFSGLIFCPHVNGDFGVVETAKKITSTLGIPTKFYSGKKPKYHTQHNWEHEKRITAKQFKKNELSVLVCTKAFGMGIDKPNPDKPEPKRFAIINQNI